VNSGAVPNTKALFPWVPELSAPLDVWTCTLAKPVPRVLGVVHEIEVALFHVTPVAGWVETPTWNVTVVLPLMKLLPVIVTEVPVFGGPLPGLMLVKIGGAVKLVADVPVPPVPVTEIGPVMAFPGTVAEMWPSSVTENDAGVPPKETPLAVVKLLPWIVTVVPVLPWVGLKLVTFGAATNEAAEVPVPAAFWAEIGPETLFMGTTTVICVLLLIVKFVVEVPLK
jgi:hypothetical protein